MSNKEVDKLAQELKNSFARWDNIMEHGSNDPFWADGVGLNLVRNHIIADKKQIDALLNNDETDSLFGSPEYPAIYYRKTPEEVDYNYMVKADEIREAAKAQIALYEQDENFQYLLSVADQLFPNKLDNKQMREAGIPYYKVAFVSYYKKAYEDDDLVSMRRQFYTSYEDKAADWAQLSAQIKEYFSQENTLPEHTAEPEPEYEDEHGSLDEMIQTAAKRSEAQYKNAPLPLPEKESPSPVIEEQLSFF